MSDERVGRRVVLCGTGVVGAAALAGCGGGGSRRAEAAQDLKGKEIAKVADIPVGGGKVLAEHKVVVTQPTRGDFKAFSAGCTHSGCLLGRVTSGNIRCPCHGSEFRITDGTVSQGPATRALLEFQVAVKADGLVIL